MKFIDLTHTFTSDMPVYPGDPKSTLEQVASIEKDTFTDHKITSVMHVGTHIDAPLHMIAGGKRIDEIAPEKFFGKGVLIDVREKDEIDESVLANITIEKDSIVLLYTGFGSKYRSPEYFEKSPVVTKDFAQKMAELGVKMVGMDMSGPDHDASWPVHKMLLEKEILILENVTNLEQLTGVESFEIIALPANLHADAAPVRVIAKII